jgi:PBP1b-binding outer membrane lipoprotein LpoB
MKTIAFIFLSLFLAKSCHQKNDSSVSKQAEQTTENLPVSEIVKTEETKPEMIENKVQTGTKVEYEAMSRGFFSKIVFENNQLTIASDRNNPEKGTVVMLSKEDISAISNLVKAVNLVELPNLKAPSEARMYDGAPHANLTITSNGNVYSGAGFDGGNPPAAIEKLVTKLVSYSEQK